MNDLVISIFLILTEKIFSLSVLSSYKKLFKFQLICCCCFDEAEGLNVDEFPVGCKKRARLLLENGEQQCDKDRNKSLSPSSPKIKKEDSEEKQNEENNNVSGMELFESDNELKLEIEEEEDEDN